MRSGAGRSPRARGSRHAPPWRERGRGPIPACAGEPRTPGTRRTCHRADPRVRGGARGRSCDFSRSTGRSLRARGSRRPPRHEVGPLGPIPACAGEPSGPTWGSRASEADPRVRGGAILALWTLEWRGGRSPRARGSRRGPQEITRGEGPIPACAGEPRARRPPTRTRRADPRVRGGAVVRWTLANPRWGRSPRARGSPSSSGTPPTRPGPIPACAGEPTRPGDRPWQRGADPRVRGGADEHAKDRGHRWGRSPRARGSRGPDGLGDQGMRPIPACAGEPGPLGPLPWQREADPRVRGGAFAWGRATRHEAGRSPRARGSPLLQTRQLRGPGPIPACAGEPLLDSRRPFAGRADPRVRGGAWGGIS